MTRFRKRCNRLPTKMLYNPAAHIHIMDKAEKVLEKEPNVLFAYLFGSSAKGKPRPDSDIDIAVYLSDPDHLKKDPLYPSRLAIKIEKELAAKAAVDIRVLNDSTLRFKHQVLKYGKLIHSKDEKRRVSFEATSISRYLDFKPFLEVYNRARKERLKA